MFNQKKEQKKMKKFWNLMLAALVIFGAVACTENQEENVPQAELKPVLSFVANIANDETRTHIEKNDEGVWETKWDGTETLYVQNAENLDEVYEFKHSETEENVFNCYDAGVNALITKPVYVYNRAYIDSTVDQDGAKLHTYEAEFNPTATISLAVQSAFFHFTAEQEVTLTASEDIFGDEDCAVEGYVNTITFSAGEHWVAFLPCECTFSYSIDGVTYKEIKDKTFEAKKIYNLGFLGVKSEYGVVGSFQGWDVAAPVAMYEMNDDGWVVAKNIELYKDDAIKIIVEGKGWDVSYGLQNPNVVAVDTEQKLITENSQDILVAKNGKFNIYFNASKLMFKYECVEEYTNLMVDITIDNKANWSPLTMTLKDGNTVIADKVAVTGNKYTVSGEHIGKTLTYQFFTNNGKQTDEDTVNITHTGATVIVKEPAVVKNMVYLKPGTWDVDGAWFAAYFWNPAAASWKKMVYNTAKAAYECEVPDNCGSVIFCRMDPAKTKLDWSSKWNQTNDITNLKSNIGKCCVITGWNGNDYKWENL